MPTPPQAEPGAPRAAAARPWALPLAALCAVAVATFLPGLPGYFWEGHERLAPLIRIEQMTQVWRAGGPLQAPWLPEICFGYGWPFFVYYAPLSNYAGALAHLLGADLGLAARLSFALAWLGGALAIFWAAWELGRPTAGAGLDTATGAATGAATCPSPAEPPSVARRRAWWAAAAATVFVTAPYHHADTFVRLALAESWAFAFLPLLFATLARARRVGARGIAAIALATAGLVLSHNITALTGGLLAALWCLLSVLPGEPGWGASARRRWLLHAAAGGALGLLLSAWFWWPAMAMKDLVAVAEAGQTWTAPSSLRHHALALRQLFLEQYGTENSIAGPADGFSLNPGLALMAGLLLSTGYLLFHRTDRTDRTDPSDPSDPSDHPRVVAAYRPRLVALLVPTWLALLATTWLMPWQWVPPLLRYVQFPWRLLLPAEVLGSLALAVAGAALARVNPPLARRLHPLALIAALGLITTFIVPARTLLTIARPGPGEPSADVQARQVYFALYEQAVGQYAGSIEREYRPRWVPVERVDPKWLLRHPAPPQRIEAPPAAGLRVLDYRRTGASYHWRLELARATSATVHVFDFPGWELRIDGVPAPAALGRSPQGLVQLALPAGSSTVELAFGLPPALRRAGLASALGLLAWLGLLAGGGFSAARRRRKAPKV